LVIRININKQQIKPTNFNKVFLLIENTFNFFIFKYIQKITKISDPTQAMAAPFYFKNGTNRKFNVRLTMPAVTTG
jgi:hypothetical protein